MDDMIYDYLDYLHMEIGLKPEDIATVPLAGCADDACSEIADKQYVIEQLAGVSDARLFEAVKSLCDDPELTCRKHAIEYIVWVLACGIKESDEWHKEYDSDTYLVSLREDGSSSVTMINSGVKR